MGLFDFFRKKSKLTNSQSDQTTTRLLENTQDIEKIHSYVENLRAQVNIVNIALKKHDDQLTEHKKLINRHSERFEKLEEKVNNVRITPAVEQTLPAVRPIQMPPSSTIPAPKNGESAQKLDINRFSQQQKEKDPGSLLSESGYDPFLCGYRQNS